MPPNKCIPRHRVSTAIPFFASDRARYEPLGPSNSAEDSVCVDAVNTLCVSPRSSEA
jgi:hypothetical protein